MIGDSILDSEIAREVERLRDQFPETQDLYREVCVLLFFRHGITPTANKLYQVVRKGSMSAPAEALRTFWEDLRDKSRVRIERPDLPEVIRTAAGELVASLWTHAQQAADQNLASLRLEASESIRAAQEAQRTAETENLGMQRVVEQVREELQASRERCSALDRDLASEKASKEAISGQLLAAGEQIRAREAALNQSRLDFASELEKQRQALERAEERLRGSEKRALLEIERERQAAIKLQTEIVQLRQAHQEAAASHLNELAAHQRMELDLRQKLGTAEGMILGQKDTLTAMTEQLASARSVLSDKEGRLMQLEREVGVREQQVSELATQVAELTARTSAPKIGKSSENRGPRKKASPE